jgi:hypothetical protein
MTFSQQLAQSDDILSCELRQLLEHDSHRCRFLSVSRLLRGSIGGEFPRSNLGRQFGEAVAVKAGEGVGAGGATLKTGYIITRFLPPKAALLAAFTLIIHGMNVLKRKCVPPGRAMAIANDESRKSKPCCRNDR